MSDGLQARVLLCILDGFGHRAQAQGNAVAEARMPHVEAWLRGEEEATHTLLDASGLAVGLPDGVMGNSEVGHIALGTGRVVYQTLVRIDRAVADGSFARNSALTAAVEGSRDAGTALHLVGLLSDGSVHSHIAHLLALLDLAKARGQAQVFVHAILDGRDTAARAAKPYLTRLEDHMAARGVGRLATLGGRFFGMDRDRRWERVRPHFDAMVHGKAPINQGWREALEQAYARGETDEFVPPTRLLPGDEGLLRDGDHVVMCNFRPDRARQLCRALWDPDFDGFDRGGAGPWPVTTLAQYDGSFPVPVAFPPEDPQDTLGEIVARAGLAQLRIAETEKYAHVTYFFNGGAKEHVFDGEERVMVPSKKEEATYDLMPAMSAEEVTDALLGRLAAQDYALVVANYANADMVGHTGVKEAAVQACEALDACLGRMVPAARAKGYHVLITADHGNAEEMVRGGQPHKAHTTNPVPLVVLPAQGKEALPLREAGGGLADVAPTILRLLGLAQPEVMDGASLLR